MNRPDFSTSANNPEIMNDSSFGPNLDKEGVKKAIIIGAGPAGLTAAYELLKRTDIVPIIIESSEAIGGSSRTINYKGNLIDVEGHRFISKSRRILKWCKDIGSSKVYNNGNQFVTGDILKDNDIFLVRQHLSKVYFLHKFFSFPISIRFNSLSEIGFIKLMKIFFSFLRSKLVPRTENNLEDYLINRFGNGLYIFFLKDYIKKIWGLPCNSISSEFGPEVIDIVFDIKQRAIDSFPGFFKDGINTACDLKLKYEVSRDLLLYPKFGQGQFWTEVARQIVEMGGQILKLRSVNNIYSKEGNFITGIRTTKGDTGETCVIKGDFLLSALPFHELISNLDADVPERIRRIALELQYVNFISVGVLLKRMSIQDFVTGEWKSLVLRELWIDVPDKNTRVARLQFFNNWSPFMVSDSDSIWMSMEFYCTKNDHLWMQSDNQIKEAAILELEKLGLATVPNLLDATVVRIENYGLSYLDTNNEFSEVKDYANNFDNLYIIGHNNMHYNTKLDHSILNAMEIIDNIYKENGEGGTTSIKDEQLQLESQDLSSKVRMGLIDYILDEPENRWFFRLAIPAIVLQFVVFKFLYPFAGFINGDSYVYLESAYHNFFVNTYPVGYSKFLRLISVFTQSDTVVVAVQYFLLQASTLALVFTLFYFYKPARLTKMLLFIFMLFNPVYLYLANYISSDAFFLSLSLTWFTLLIWIMNQPSKWLILANSLVLFMAFCVRYNALFYPIISAVALLLTRRKVFMNIAGFGLSMLLIGAFMLSTTNRYIEVSGHSQFTPFTGWQMANNALYAYRYVDSADRKDVPVRLKELDRMVRNYFDSSRDIRTHPTEMLIASTVYMWDQSSPLSIYMESKFKRDSSASALKKWATVAPIMKDYGTFLIKSYPSKFVKYYLIPNAIKYYAPPVEFLDTYSTGVDSVNDIAKVWFGYKSNKIKCYFKDFKVTMLDFYPILTGTMNVVLVFSLISFIILRGYRQSLELTKGLILLVALWGINFGFSVFASPIALRFQLFPILISLSFTFLLMEFLIKAARGTAIDKSNYLKDMELGSAKNVPTT
jgi:protoporphyrinogen oxidase